MLPRRRFLTVGVAWSLGMGCSNDGSSGDQGSGTGSGGAGGSVDAGGNEAGGNGAGGAPPAASGGRRQSGGRGAGDGGRAEAAGGAASGGTRAEAGGALSTGGGPSEPTAVLTGGVVHLMPFGDSITFGVNGGYRNLVYTKLVEDGYEVDMVGSEKDSTAEIPDGDHEGHAGFTVGQLRSGIDGWLASTTAPDVVLLMAGTNDLIRYVDDSVSKIAERLFELVDHLREKLPDVVIVVASIPPQSSANANDTGVDRATLVGPYNNEIVTRVNAHPVGGTKVVFADVNRVVTTDDLTDGIHPSRAAHDDIAMVFYDVLKLVLP